MRRMLVAIGIVIVLGVLIVRFGSGLVAEKAARQYFAEKHIDVDELRFGHASLRSAMIANARLGKGNALSLRNALLSYQYRDGKVNPYNASIERIGLKLRTYGGKWDIGGLEALFGLAPLDAARDAQALMIDATAAIEVNLKATRLSATLKQGDMTFTQGALQLHASPVEVTITPTEKEGVLEWTMAAQGVELKEGEGKLTTPLVLMATGTFDGRRIEGQGMLSDVDKRIPLILRFTHDLTAEKTTVQWTSDRIVLTGSGKELTHLSPALEAVPPFDAEVRMDGSAIIEAGKKPRITHRILVDRAALSPILTLFFKDDMAISGDVSGEIPIRWGGEKAPQVTRMKLTNAAPGTLVYDPLTGPAGALQQEAQAGLLLEALRKFEYTTLTLTADSDAEGVLKAQLHLIGANPDLYGGKTVDFTLNVNANLLSILESQAKVNDVIEQSNPKK